jgi:bla regulator protein blaR1
MSGWILETLAMTSVLLGVVLLIRRPVAAKFGPRFAYGLWLLPALRLILPPLPAIWCLRENEIVLQPLPVRFAELPVALGSHGIIPPGAAPGSPAASSLPVDWMIIGLAAWVSGAIVFCIWHLIAYRRFARRTLAPSTALDVINPGAIALYASPRVAGPLAMGILRRIILVPDDFAARYDPDEQASAIAHEVAHHARGDLRVNIAALFFLSLHWFNPIAHFAWRAFRRDQELACDAAVMAIAKPEARHAYGRALVKSAYDRVPLAACALTGKQELKRRLRMIGYGKISKARAITGAALSAILFTSGLALTASTGAVAEEAPVTPPVRVVIHGDKVSIWPVTSGERDASEREAQAELAAQASESEQEMNREVERAARELQESQREARKLTEEGRAHGQAVADEASVAVREAAQDAQERVKDAQERAAEARADAREAAIEAAAEAASAASLGGTVGGCRTGQTVVLSRNEPGGHHDRNIVVICPKIDEAAIKASVVNVLKAARTQISALQVLDPSQKTDALRALDIEIGRAVASAPRLE